MKKIILSFLLLILFLVSTSQIPLRNVYANVVITQKNKTLNTDIYSIVFYDNANIKYQESSPTLLSSGYFVELTFICEDSNEQLYITKAFYNGAECALKFNTWNESLYCNGIVLKIETNSPGIVSVIISGTTTIAKNYRQIRKLQT